jgi:hypothetical protein
MQKVAKVIVDVPTMQTDQPFTYLVPENLNEQLAVATPPLVLSTEHWFRQEPLQPLVQWLEQTLEHADYRYQKALLHACRQPIAHLNFQELNK